MHTDALIDHQILNCTPNRKVNAELVTPLRAPADRTAPQAVLAGLALLTISASTWYLGGVTALAVLGVLLSSALLIGVLLQRAQTRSGIKELTRFVGSLGQSGEPGNLASFDLRHPWKNAAREILGSYDSLLRQLRERHAAVQKLELSHSLVQAAQRRAEAVLGSLSESVLVTNAFGELVTANPEAERVLGFKLDRVRGKPVRQGLHAPALVQMIEQVTQRSGGPQRHTEELPLKSGDETRWFKVNVANVIDRTTEPVGIITVLRDITSEKAAQARSAEFVSAVSHEIKTPLASVKAYAEMLADGDADGDPETQQKFLNIIEVQTDRMTRLLDSMLDIARIESGVVRVEKKIVSLNELVESGAKLMAPGAAEKNLTVEQRLSSLYVPVSVDPDMMSRVVMNLISNAIKYTDRGGRITLRSQIQHDRAIFEVEDSGRGIPADALPRLFEKFYRVKENAGVAPGTGLGLSLVRHIVEEVHGGKVEVESEVAKGSIFRVRLPLEQLN